jgi:hypothetical protein
MDVGVYVCVTMLLIKGNMDEDSYPCFVSFSWCYDTNYMHEKAFFCFYLLVMPRIVQVN